jgi:hypothetical protein
MKPMELPQETLKDLDELLCSMRNLVITYRSESAYDFRNPENRAIFLYAQELESRLANYFAIPKKRGHDPRLPNWLALLRSEHGLVAQGVYPIHTL